MRYIKISGGNEFCGEDFEVYVVSNANANDDELDFLTAKFAEENNELYENRVWGLGITSALDYAQTYGASIEEAEELKEKYFTSSWAQWEEISEAQYLKGLEP